VRVVLPPGNVVVLGVVVVVLVVVDDVVEVVGALVIVDPCRGGMVTGTETTLFDSLSSAVRPNGSTLTRRV